MAKAAMNIQDSFLNQMRKDGADAKFVMLDGSSLIGAVKGFDNFTVIVASRNAQHLLYKHAISQIVMRRPSRKEEGEGAAEEGAAPNDDNAASPRTGGPPKDRDSRAGEDKEDQEGRFNPIDLSGLHVSENSAETPKPKLGHA